MKFEKNEKYFTICIYGVMSTIVVIIATIVLLRWTSIWGIFKTVLVGGWNLMKPLLFAFVFAYLIDPIIGFYDEKFAGLRTRLIPTVLGGITLLALLGLCVLIITINIKDVLGKGNLNNFLQEINYYVKYFNDMLIKANGWVQAKNLSFVDYELVNKAYNMVNTLVLNVSGRLVESMVVVGANLINILIALVISFYLLHDKEKILRIWNKILEKLLTKKVFKEVCKIGRDIDYVFSGYIRGQLIDASIVAILISTALTIININFAIIIGFIAGVFNLIPYFGPIVGIVLAGFIGMMGPTPIKGIYAIVAVLIIQQIDGWIIVPKVIGESVKLPPVVVLISILLGGNLFGLVGMLLGVPVAAFIRVLMLRYWKEIFS